MGMYWGIDAAGRLEQHLKHCPCPRVFLLFAVGGGCDAAYLHINLYNEEDKDDMANTKRALKREQILEAAMDLLKGNSYDEIRVEDIAKASKMAKSMIFYYFTSKASVYLKILHNLHVKLVEDFINELEQIESMSGAEFKGFAIKMTDKYIKDHYLLIKLLEYEDIINSECENQEVVEEKRRLTALYDELHSKVLAKVKDLNRNEIFYIFEVQMHFIRGYYRQMISSGKYDSNYSDDLLFERKSLYEFRVVRMLRFFIDGILCGKSKN